MATKTKVPTKAELAEYFEHDKKRLSHLAAARDIDRVQGETEAKVIDYVRAKAGDERCLILHGYRLSIELAQERAEWKTALLVELANEIGQAEALRVAARISKAAGQKEKAKIEPPAAKSGPTGDKPKPAKGLLF